MVTVPPAVVIDLESQRAIRWNLEDVADFGADAFERSTAGVETHALRFDHLATLHQSYLGN